MILADRKSFILLLFLWLSPNLFAGEVEATSRPALTPSLVPMACFAKGSDPALVEKAHVDFWESRLRTSLEAPGSPHKFTFSDQDRWSATATDGEGLTQGDVTTLTWSIVPDGTSIFGYNGEATAPSDLRSFLDGIYNDEATWLPIFRRVFERWEQLNGVRYIYEPSDDGSPWTQNNIDAGQLGVRGDVRIAGHFIDGDSNVLAYNFFPNFGDMVIDTSDDNYEDTSNDSLVLRNILAHEHGHGLGLGHVCPENETKLMEPRLSTAFDGPQPDDILATNRGYGDALEGNDTPATATYLGNIPYGSGLLVEDVSIDDDSDRDIYSFSVPAGGRLKVTVAPVGDAYLSGPQNPDGSCSAGSLFNAKRQQDLRYEVLDTDGVRLLTSVNFAGPGGVESFANIPLPSAGTYFLKVIGSFNQAQLYTATLEPLPAPRLEALRENGEPFTNIYDLLDLGTSYIQSLTRRHVITLRNSGTADLTNVFAFAEGRLARFFTLDFEGTGSAYPPGGVTLAPGDEIELGVRFNGFSFSFPFSALLRIHNTDSLNPFFTIPIQGSSALFDLQSDAYFKASTNDFPGLEGASFGSSTDLSGELMIIGAPEESSGGSGVGSDHTSSEADRSGAAYIYRLDDGAWQEEAFLKASNTGAYDRFGTAVAIDGKIAVVGAYFEHSGATGVDGDQLDNSTPGAGAAYVFENIDGSWVQTAYLKASNADRYDYFGYSVAVSGETILVGALGEDSDPDRYDPDDNSMQSAGAAYVFERADQGWRQSTILKTPNADPFDYFGLAVAIDSDTIAVSAPYEDGDASQVGDNVVTNSGAIYVYVKDGDHWQGQDYLKASNVGVNDFFGVDVDIDGDTIVVGTPFEDSDASEVGGDGTSDALSDSGAVYVFRQGQIWQQEAYVKSPSPAAGARFGWSVDISGELIVVGAPNKAIGVDSNAGMSHVYVRQNSSWLYDNVSLQLGEFYVNANAQGGHAVSIHGESVAMCGPGENTPFHSVLEHSQVVVLPGTTLNPGSGACSVYRLFGAP